jgi:hypothetical protein
MAAPTLQPPTVSKIVDPRAFCGPAQGPPPIANRPTGNTDNENQHSYSPDLNRLCPVSSVMMYSLLDRLGESVWALASTRRNEYFSEI